MVDDSVLLGIELLNQLSIYPTFVSLSQWLNFKLSGITCLVGKISRLNFYLRVHWLSESWDTYWLQDVSTSNKFPTNFSPFLNILGSAVPADRDEEMSRHS